MELRSQHASRNGTKALRFFVSSGLQRIVRASMNRSLSGPVDDIVASETAQRISRMPTRKLSSVALIKTESFHSSKEINLYSSFIHQSNK